MANQWEHASVAVTKSSVEMVSAGGARTLDADGGSLRRGMTALDGLSAEGWEVVDYTLSRAIDESLFATYLLRRPKVSGEPTVY